MNYLALGQRLALECGISGTLASMQNQTGELLRIVTWVNQAWNDVQTEHDDWNFMRSSALLGAGMSFTTVSGQASYPLGMGSGTCGIPAANFGKWNRHTFRNFSTSVGYENEIFMDYVPFDAWRDSYMYGAQRSVKTRPIALAIGPDESICLGPPPDGTYTITGDYFKAPTMMVEDIDVPMCLPVQQHMIIVYQGMMSYAGYEAASEVFQRGQAGYSKMLAELEAIKAPEISFAGSL